jgi:hypothetical protein
MQANANLNLVMEDGRDVLNLGWRQLFATREADRMDYRFNLSAPEFQKFVDARVGGREIESLPGEAL